MSTDFYTHFRIVTDETEYTKKNVLGSGAFGVTYLATKDNKNYVIKEIQISTDNTKALLNEVNVLKRIKKFKCISKLLCYHDSFININKGTLSIVTKSFKNAITLREYIDNLILNEVFLSYEDIIKIFSNLLLGLNHLHKIGIAHGDVKPENILIEQKYLNIQYIDFGLSCTENCKPSGTLLFASPEILKQIPANMKESTKTVSLKIMQDSDIFSLGVVFYLLANLQMPVPIRTSTEAEKLSAREEQAEAMSPGIFIYKDVPLLGLINFYINRSSSIISFYNYNSTKVAEKINVLIETMLDMEPKPEMKKLLKQLKKIQSLYKFASSEKLLIPRKLRAQSESSLVDKSDFEDISVETGKEFKFGKLGPSKLGAMSLGDLGDLDSSDLDKVLNIKNL